MSGDLIQQLLDELAAERAEVVRLRAERDDLEVLLRGRTAELQAEVERLRAMVEPIGYDPQPKCVKDPRRSCVSWITCRMSEECYYDYQVRVSNRSGQPSK